MVKEAGVAPQFRDFAQNAWGLLRTVGNAGTAHHTALDQATDAMETG